MHKEMLALQTQVLSPHTYQSNWPDWVTNTRAIWYFYEPVDGVQRGVLMLGNPLTMLLGIPALIWCLFTGITNREWPRIAMVTGYLASLGLWFIAEKIGAILLPLFYPTFLSVGRAGSGVRSSMAQRAPLYAIGDAWRQPGYVCLVLSYPDRRRACRSTEFCRLCLD